MDDISPSFIRSVVLNAIEHLCLRDIIYDREISPNEITEDLCSLLFQGIERRRVCFLMWGLLLLLDL